MLTEASTRCVIVLTMLAVSVSACVPDSAKLSVQSGRYTDYHDMMRSLSAKVVEKQSAPGDVKAKFANCAADYAVKAFTPEELARLDQYARGSLDLTVGELKQLDQVSRDRVNETELTADSLDRLDTTCPQDVPSFREYLRFPL